VLEAGKLDLSFNDPIMNEQMIRRAVFFFRDGWLLAVA
jgi:hypothetical protein